MIYSIYFIILSYFILGAIGFYFINRKKDVQTARNSWTKFITYFFIIHILFFSICFFPTIFKTIAILISVVSLAELIRLFVLSKYAKRFFFFGSLVLLVLILWGFILYSGLNLELVLYPFLILSIFDSFSQISGQLFGKRKLLPAISPNKTVGGLLGGLIIAFLSSFFIGKHFNFSFDQNLVFVIGILVFAFLGDIAASFYKRQYSVKDFSRLLPGHGGFLDRFDSLIAVGCWVTIYNFLL